MLNLCPLWEVADGEGNIQSTCAFSMSGLALCKYMFGWFGEDSGKFVEEFVKLAIYFDLTWLMDITCFTLEVKQRILGTAHEHTDGMVTCNQGHAVYCIWGDAVLDLDPQ